MFGGWNGTEVNNDIWNSSDGINWVEVTKHAPFDPRAAFAMTVFKNRLWLIGGLYFDKNSDIKDKNDVWVSSDGTNWKRVVKHAQFSPRGGHSAIVFNNKIWIMGGFAESSDIWSSIDGKNWKIETKSTPFGSRGGHANIVFDNKIWIIGGIFVDKKNTFNSLSDVWYSKNGKEWNRASDDISFFAGGGHSSVVYNNKLWVMGGFRKSGTVFTSRDGINWDQDSYSANFGERVAHSCLVFKDKIWVIGGYNGAKHMNDIWYLAPPAP